MPRAKKAKKTRKSIKAKKATTSSDQVKFDLHFCTSYGTSISTTAIHSRSIPTG